MPNKVANGSFELIKAIYDCDILNKFKLSPSAKLVLIGISQYYRADIRKAWPSQVLLSKKLGLSTRTIINSVKELVDNNIILKYRNKRPSGNFSNVYYFSGFFWDSISFYLERTSDKDYIIWRDSIFKKDNYTCQKCNKKGGNLNAHHILSYEDNPQNRFDIKNGMTLCEKCHKELHS